MCLKNLFQIWDGHDAQVDDIFANANICQIFETDLIPRSMIFFTRQIFAKYLRLTWYPGRWAFFQGKSRQSPTPQWSHWSHPSGWSFSTANWLCMTYQVQTSLLVSSSDCCFDLLLILICQTQQKHQQISRRQCYWQIGSQSIFDFCLTFSPKSWKTVQMTNMIIKREE